MGRTIAWLKGEGLVRNYWLKFEESLIRLWWICSELNGDCFFFLIAEVIFIWPNKHSGVSNALPAIIFYRDMELWNVYNKCSPVKFLLVDVYPLSVLAFLSMWACIHIHMHVALEWRVQILLNGLSYQLKFTKHLLGNLCSIVCPSDISKLCLMEGMEATTKL